jgi:hypothetical protein
VALVAGPRRTDPRGDARGGDRTDPAGHGGRGCHPPSKRAGLARAPHEGPLAFSERAAARWPQFAIAFHAIGQSFATLRYGEATARPRERAAMLATLERAIEVLPGSGALRNAPG